MSNAPSAEAPAAIVTGAGSGVGRCVAQRLSALGWRVALAARTEHALRETAERCEGRDACLIAPTDLSEPGAAARLVSDAHGAFGRLDAVINNAGAASLVPIADVTIDALQDSFAVNAFAPAQIIAAAFPIMVAQRGGRVVNVASKGIRDPFPGFFAYAAAKSALDSFTRSVHNEGRRRGVRAFTVAPGAIETPMLRAMWDQKQLPTDQTLEPDEVARVVVECAAGERDDESGQTIFLSA